jgi:hypothetical protein
MRNKEMVSFTVAKKSGEKNTRSAGGRGVMRKPPGIW